MSQTQIEATALLCRMLESTAKEISGPLLSDPGNQDALAQLRREHLVGFGEPLNWLQCPECRDDMARVVRELPGDKVLLLCGGDCEDFEAPRSVCHTTVVNTERVVGHLATGLDLNRHHVECLVPDLAWRMGLVEERRGKPVTWYFARHLNRDTTAQKLLTHLSGHRADRSARILTSSPVPLPASSPLAQYEVVHLADLMRVSQNRFEWFANRVMEPTAVYQVHDSATDRGTTLRYVRSERNAYIDGVAYPLEAMQANILLALIDDFDHRMEGSALRDACGSDAERFAPIKFFGRNPQVYKTFIRYIFGDKEYALIIPDGDRDWLH
ncbi:hypothetical protein [Dechloromonas sp.]|uniref:hypothetical protein n=1 Tax=Dechloromonas sp. TaxID=1917218 RepID=UPI00217163D9|nr:hypothetical protein [Dechloromonas sp.]MBU3697809.1 hypothetical protein [Dechloromonas sp.]